MTASTRHRSAGPRELRSSGGPDHRRLTWEDGKRNGELAPQAEFAQEFDFRTMPHRPGVSLRASILGRPTALRLAAPAVQAQAKQRSSVRSIDNSWQMAADNAQEAEWVSARAEIESLAKKSMCAAETGVRLQALLRRIPGLLAHDLGAALLSDVEGEGTSAAA